MAFKSEYSKEELQEIITDKRRYSEELANSMGLILNNFEKHQIFPPKEMVMENLSAGHLPFLFKNYYIEKEELKNIKLMVLKAKNYKIFETQNNNINKINFNSFDIESVSDFENETIDKIKDVTKEETQDLSVSGIAKTLMSGIPAIYSSDVHDLNFLNELVQHKDFYDANNTNYEFEEDELEDSVRVNTEAFVINLVNSLDIKQFESLPIDTLKKINFYLKEQDYGDSFISNMLAKPSYLKKKYMFDDYFNVTDVRSSVLDIVTEEEAYVILRKAYENEVGKSDEIKKKLLIGLYDNGEVWSTVRSIKKLNKEKINEIFENNFVPTWDDNVPKDKIEEVRKKLVNFSKYGVVFSMGMYPFIPKEVLPLIFNKEFSDKIYAHAKDYRDAFNLTSREYQNNIPESIIHVMRHQIPNDINADYPESLQNDLTALFSVVRNRGVYDDSQNAIYRFSIEILNSSHLMKNFEFAKPIVEEWRKNKYFDYVDIKEPFIQNFSEISADNMLILNGAGFTKEAKDMLHKLNPVDVEIIKSILIKQGQGENFTDVQGTESMPISTSLNAPYKRMPRKPGYYCADLLIYSGENFFEQIKKPEFKMSGEFAISSLSYMNHKNSDDVNLFTFWIAENFRKYPEELPDLNDSDVKDLFTKYQNLREFVKVKDYSYEDIMHLNAKYIAINDSSTEGKIKAESLKKEFSIIPEEVVDSFIKNYVKNKDWEKQDVPLLNEYRLKGYAFYNNALDCPGLEQDVRYIRSGFDVPVLNESQASLFLSVCRSELNKSGAYSVSSYEIEHLLRNEDNKKVLFDLAIKDYPVFFISPNVRKQFKEQLDSLGDEKLGDLFTRAVSSVQINELKPLFEGDTSKMSLTVGEGFWEILASKTYSFKEKFILSEVLSSACSTNSMNINRLRESIQYVLDINGIELNKPQEELLQGDNFSVNSVFGCSLIFPDLFSLKNLEKNQDEFNLISGSHHINLYKFDFEVCPIINGKIDNSNKNTKIDFDISDKFKVWEKVSELKNAFNKDFEKGISLFGSILDGNSDFKKTKAKLSNFVLINDDNFNGFMKIMSGESRINVANTVTDKFTEALKELVVSSIVSEGLSSENKLILAEVNKSMVLSEKYFYNAKAPCNYYTKEILLSPEVTATLAAYTLKEKIKTSFDNFNTKSLDDVDSLSNDNEFKL